MSNENTPHTTSHFRGVATPWYDLGFVVLPATDAKTPDVPRFRQYCEGSDKTDDFGKVWAREYATPALLKQQAARRPNSNGLVLLDSHKDPTLRLVVVDVDDPILMQWAIDQFGPTPYSVSTGRAGGGTHLYYRCEVGIRYQQLIGEIGPVEGWHQRKDGQWRTKIDIKSAANYAIAPGSIHKTGVPYVANVPVTEELLRSLPTLDWQKLDSLRGVNSPAAPLQVKEHRVTGVPKQPEGFSEFDITAGVRTEGNSFFYADFSTTDFPGYASLLAFCDSQLPGQGKKKIGCPFRETSVPGAKGTSAQVVRKGSKLSVVDHFERKRYYHREGIVGVQPGKVTERGTTPCIKDYGVVPLLPENREPCEVDTEQFVSSDPTADLRGEPQLLGMERHTKYLVADILAEALHPKHTGRYDESFGDILSDETVAVQVDTEFQKLGHTKGACCSRGRTSTSVKRKGAKGVHIVNAKAPCNAYQCPACGHLQRTCLQASGAIAMRVLCARGWQGRMYTEHVPRESSRTLRSVEKWVARSKATRQYLSIQLTPHTEAKHWNGYGVPSTIIAATPPTVVYVLVWREPEDTPQHAGTDIEGKDLEAVVSGLFGSVNPKDWLDHGRACVLGGSRVIRGVIASLRDAAYGRNKKRNEERTDSNFLVRPIVHNMPLKDVRDEIARRAPGMDVVVVHRKETDCEVGFLKSQSESLRVTHKNPLLQEMLESGEGGSPIAVVVVNGMQDDEFFKGQQYSLTGVELIGKATPKRKRG